MPKTATFPDHDPDTLIFLFGRELLKNPIMTHFYNSKRKADQMIKKRLAGGWWSFPFPPMLDQEEGRQWKSYPTPEKTEEWHAWNRNCRAALGGPLSTIEWWSSEHFNPEQRRRER